MKKYLWMTMVLVFGMGLALSASPVFAGCDDCAQRAAEQAAVKEAGAAHKQCPAGCMKPCCAGKAQKFCPMHHTKDNCTYKKNSNAQQNFGPRRK